MKHTLLFALSLLMVAPAFAQPDRASGTNQDVIWARDIGTADITVDGELNEAVWAQAESYNITWGNDERPLPGSGYWFDVNPFSLTEAPDPTDATVSFLRKGNELFIGVEAKDASIGGSRNLFRFDGLMMALINKNDRPETFTDRRNYFESSAVRMELVYGWHIPNDADTSATGQPEVGLGPRLWSTDFGLTFGDSTDAEPRNPEALSYAATVDGVSGDDFNGNATLTPDVGYTLELRIRLDSLGWDLTEPMSRMPMSLAINDMDYAWPQDENRFNVNRTWWMGRWLNNFNEGVAYVAGDPGVTVSSGELPAYMEPEFTVPNGNFRPAPTIDGQLDEEVWADVDPQFSIKYQASADELDAGLPGVLAPVYTFYFSGGSNPVIDPSVGRFHMFYQGSKLYVGVDADDAAISGGLGEGGDGFRLAIANLDSLKSGLNGARAPAELIFSIDSTGTVVKTNYAAALDTLFAGEYAIDTGVYFKPSSGGTGGVSTVGNSDDIDTGYQMELAIDLRALGYPEDLNNEQIWVSMQYFDRDDLPTDTESYSARTWVQAERGAGASIYGLLDANTQVGVAGEAEASDGRFRSLGTAPNPASGLTRLRYELPRASEVTVEVFDVLGRRVQEMKVGLQAEGRQAVEIDGAALGAGTYLYRVTMQDGASVTGRMTIVR